MIAPKPAKLPWRLWYNRIRTNHNQTQQKWRASMTEMIFAQLLVTYIPTMLRYYKSKHKYCGVSLCTADFEHILADQMTNTKRRDITKLWRLDGAEVELYPPWI